MTPDDRMAIDALLSELPELDIELLGGLDCATELAVVAVAFRHFETDRGRRSEQIDEVVNAGYLKEPPELWSHFHTDELVPHENSGCRAPSEVDIYKGCLERADELRSERTTYLAQNPGAPEPMQDDLIEAGLRKYFDSSMEIIEGVVVGFNMDACEEVDFG